MCWKQEWASAIGNIEHAKEHILRAQKKLLKRKARNEETLEKLRGNKRLGYPKELQRVEDLIAKNTYGARECKIIREHLEAEQDRLYRLITDFGISRATTSKRLRQNMGKYVPPEERKEVY